MQERNTEHLKVIVLAAGSGSRLRPLTDNAPKCMVDINGVKIIDHILSTINDANIKQIKIIGGYKFDVLRKYLNTYNVELVENQKYATTNMVASLFGALCNEDLTYDLIISYSDIIYNAQVLNLLVSSSYDISVVIDKDWKRLWKLRMNNPLDDAETLKISSDNNIIEIGKKAKTYDDIEGQYIGLIKISSKILPCVYEYYNKMDKNKLYDGKTFDNMFMTSFLQELINAGFEIKPVYINRGWLEVDSTEDLDKYKKDGKYNLVEFKS